MPYIDPKRREEFKKFLNDLFNFNTLSKGDVVFCITWITHKYVLDLGKPCFDTKSTGKSILQDALDEYKRVVMNKHENKKRRENGPISDLDSLTLEDVR